MSQPPQRYARSLLLIAIDQAIKTGEAERDPVLHAERLQRFAELDQQDWETVTTHVPELAAYQTLTEAIVQTAQTLDLPLPPVEDRSLEALGGPRAGFSAAVAYRSLRALIFDESAATPYYAIDLFDGAAHTSYQGDAPTLVEMTRLISDWLAQDVPITTLVQRYMWMRPEPVRPSWRIRIDNG